MTQYLQGQYKPHNPKKYKGNVHNIVFRSSLELVAFKFCDTNPAIVYWASEECVIPYRSPVDNRMHRYFMDLKVWTRKPDTEELGITLIEIKPIDKTRKPRKGNKSEKTWVNECMEWAVNSAKWAAAEEYCKKEGWAFIKWTEEELVPGRDPDIRNRLALKSKKKRDDIAMKRRSQEEVRLLAEQLKKRYDEKMNAKD